MNKQSSGNLPVERDFPVTKSANIKIAVKNSSVEALINNEEVFSTLSKEVINECMITQN